MKKVLLIVLVVIQSVFAFYENDYFVVSMFYDMQDSAIVNKDTMHGKDDPAAKLANWEVEIAGALGENISWSYVGAYNHNDDTWTNRDYGPVWETGMWEVRYSFSEIFGISYGQLDLPVGIDYRYYGAPDKFNTADSLAEELHGAPNEDILMVSGESDIFNYALYRSAGNQDNQHDDGGSLLYLEKDSVGGRVGIFLCPQLELGYSRLIEEAPSDDLDNAFVRDIESYDLTLNLGKNTQVLAETVRSGYGSGLANANYVMLVNQLGDWIISNRYGELNYDNANQDDLQRIANGINYSFSDNFRVGVDHQRNVELVKAGNETSNDIVTWQMLLMF